jgi:antitoxin (DNA-binding transcriptional repressor) of toxin-antitoxin stability system
LLDRVRAGDEVVIEHDAYPVAVLRPAAPAQSIDKIFAAIAQDVPDEEWYSLAARKAQKQILSIRRMVKEDGSWE